MWGTCIRNSRISEKTCLRETGKSTLLLNRLVELQKANKAEWLILFNTTKGSKYARAVDDIYSLLTESLMEQFADRDRV